MSNLRFSDSELDTMTTQPNAQAMRIGRAIPYHLAYARVNRDNSIINPRLPGQRPTADQEKEATDNETD